jgi:predicted sulfurtransferase
MVHGAGGYRSSIAASLLLRHGFAHVSEIAGGIGAWEAGAPADRDGHVGRAVSLNARKSGARPFLRSRHRADRTPSHSRSNWSACAFWLTSSMRLRRICR